MVFAFVGVEVAGYEEVFWELEDQSEENKNFAGDIPGFLEEGDILVCGPRMRDGVGLA